MTPTSKNLNIKINFILFMRLTLLTFYLLVIIVIFVYNQSVQ